VAGVAWRHSRNNARACEFGTFTLNGHLGKTLQTAVCVEYPRSPRRVKLPVWTHERLSDAI